MLKLETKAQESILKEYWPCRPIGPAVDCLGSHFLFVISPSSLNHTTFRGCKEVILFLSCVHSKPSGVLVPTTMGWC